MTLLPLDGAECVIEWCYFRLLNGTFTDIKGFLDMAFYGSGWQETGVTSRGEQNLPKFN